MWIGATPSVLSTQELLDRAVGHANAGRLGTASRLLDLAAARDPDVDQAALVVGTRAYVLAARGEAATAAQLCRDALATPGLSSRTTAVLAGQLGLVLIHLGDFAEAAPMLDVAARGLDHEPGRLANVLLNRGMLADESEDLALAEACFSRAADAFRRAGNDVGAAKAQHNAALVLLARGDLVGAQREMAEARAVLAPLGPELAATCDLAHAELLLFAGMPREAVGLLEGAATAYGRARWRRQQAEAELSIAKTYRLYDVERALPYARAAARRFARVGDAVGNLRAQAAIARLELAGTAGPSGPPTRTALRHAVEVRDALAAGGLRDSARQLARYQASALARGGDVAGARARLATARPRANESVVDRAHYQEVSAEVAAADGHHRTALRRARAGMDLVKAWQERYEDVDLRTSMSVHRLRLLVTGTTSAVALGDAEAVLAWSELTRGLVSRTTPVQRSAELDLAAARRGETTDRPLAAPGSDWRERSPWSGPASQVGGGLDVAGLTATLAAQEAVLVSYLRTDQEIAAVVLDPAAGGPRLVRLGAWSPIAADVSALLADLDMAAARLRPAMAGAVQASLRRRLATIADALLAPLGLGGVSFGRGPVSLGLGLGKRGRGRLRRLVVTAPPAVSSLPWNLMPGLESVAVSVPETLEDWLRRARVWAGAGADGGGGVVGGVGAAGSAAEAGAGAASAAGVSAAAVSAGIGPAGGPAGSLAPPASAGLVAGPNLADAAAEVEACAAVWPVAQTLTGDGATAAAVTALADSHEVLHIAAHGRHTADNPLFSGFELVDGPWFGYDIELLAHVPRYVVLSSCELGRSSAVWGQETVGMARAWLHAGARCVVAAPARVPDSAGELVVALHRALADGIGPADALAALGATSGARSAGPDGARPPGASPAAALVCFGNGW